MVKHEERRKIPQWHRTNTAPNQGPSTLRQVGKISSESRPSLESNSDGNGLTSGVSTAYTFLVTIREMALTDMLANSEGEVGLEGEKAREVKKSQGRCRTTNSTMLFNLICMDRQKGLI